MHIEPVWDIYGSPFHQICRQNERLNNRRRAIWTTVKLSALAAVCSMPIMVAYWLGQAVDSPVMTQIGVIAAALGTLAMMIRALVNKVRS